MNRLSRILDRDLRERSEKRVEKSCIERRIGKGGDSSIPVISTDVHAP